jgi:hypothetical protein
MSVVFRGAMFQDDLDRIDNCVKVVSIMEQMA